MKLIKIIILMGYCVGHVFLSALSAATNVPPEMHYYQVKGAKKGYVFDDVSSRFSGLIVTLDEPRRTLDMPDAYAASIMFRGLACAVLINNFSFRAEHDIISMRQLTYQKVPGNVQESAVDVGYVDGKQFEISPGGRNVFIFEIDLPNAPKTIYLDYEFEIREAGGAPENFKGTLELKWHKGKRAYY